MKAIQVMQRLREPSTWAGLSALALLFGVPPGTIDAVGMLLGGAAAVGAILLPETKAAAQ